MIEINKTSSYPRIGLFLKHNNLNVIETFEKLLQFLKKRGHTLSIEKESARSLSSSLIGGIPLIEREMIGQHIDLAIVSGGDGSLLNAARAIADYQVPILGINRGRLGFLADILPDSLEEELGAVLDGIYTKEKRFLLNARIIRENKILAQSTALNDVVLYTGSIARMVDFEVYIDNHFVLKQQADGIITATPTGSTAYALSAGGPILYPTLNAITVTPLCPHTLSSRPIVVESQSVIRVALTLNNDISPKVSFDGQLHFDLSAGDQIVIERHPRELTLIHPEPHDFYAVLREKLGWSARQLKD